MFGYKHNQTMWFLQTLGFLGFVTPNRPIERLEYIYSFRFAWFDYGNALHGIIPSDFAQESKGNFPNLEIDSSLVRVAGTTLLIAAIVAVLSGTMRLVNLLIPASSTRYLKKKKLRKPAYRALEFFYKCCMYPLLFFSLVTLRDWRPQMLVPHERYLALCHGLAIVLPAAYLAVTIMQLWF